MFQISQKKHLVIGTGTPSLRLFSVWSFSRMSTTHNTRQEDELCKNTNFKFDFIFHVHMMTITKKTYMQKSKRDMNYEKENMP